MRSVMHRPQVNKQERKRLKCARTPPVCTLPPSALNKLASTPTSIIAGAETRHQNTRTMEARARARVVGTWRRSRLASAAWRFGPRIRPIIGRRRSRHKGRERATPWRHPAPRYSPRLELVFERPCQGREETHRLRDFKRRPK